jgi:AAHS family 4-hydroxybenzoate transporter-like MFS transporter
MANSSQINIRETIESHPLTTAQIGVVVLCALIALLDGYDLQVIGLAAPSIAKLLNIPPPQMGGVFSAALAGLALGAFALGPIADRFGRKIVLIGCTLCFGIFTLATPLASSYESLLLVRFLTGLGLGGAAPSFIALGSEYVPASKRATTVALLWAGFPIGGVVGGLLASSIIPALGWEWLFWIGGILPIVLTAVIAFSLPESLGFLVSSGAPTAKISALLKSVCGVQVPADATFVLGEERAERGSVRELFAHGRAFGTLLLWISFFVAYMQLVTNSAWSPILLSRVGVAVPSSAFALAVFNFGSVIGTSAAGWLIARFGGTVVMPVSLLGTTIAYGLIGYAAPDITQIVVLEGLVGLFLGCASSALIALSAIFYPTAIRSTGVGWAMALGRFGSFVGPLVVGSLLGAGWGIGAIFAAIAAPAIIAAVTAALIPSKQPATTASPVLTTA